MEQETARLLGIAPYEGMKLAMEREAAAFPGLRLDVRTGDLEAGADIVRALPEGAYDCIISRGGTAQLLRQVTDIPVVEIELSVYDVLRAIKLAENYTDLFAVVGFPNVTEPAYTLCDLLRSNVDVLTVHSAREAARTLSRLKEGGYRMVVGDMVTHTLAQEMGLDAFLVTSGTEAIRGALEQALTISARSRALRRENLFLRSVVQARQDRVVVLEEDGSLFCAIPPDPPAGLLEAFRGRIGDIPGDASLKFYQGTQDQFFSITARALSLGGIRYFLFHCRADRIPLRPSKTGLRIFSKGECAHLFADSFYSVSGAMGELDAVLTSAAAIRQPVMILGEPGTEKEQIARALYLRGPLSAHPFVAADCAVMNEKSWDFLLNHHSSPLNASGSTIYFQHFESAAPGRRIELLSVIQETDLARRNRLIFSCTNREDAPPGAERLFSIKLGGLVLRLPTLRSSADEIPSLANRLLAVLNPELGRQIIGFEPRAMELLRGCEWPYNYTQFKGALSQLALLTASPYIRGDAVAEVLSRERDAAREPAPAAPPGGRTLDQIIRDAVLGALSDNQGSQTAAARQLGISRTTLWRYLKQKEPSAP